MTKTSTDLAARVDAELLAFLARERAALEPEAEPLLDELESLIAAGGKRLRPRFCYWGFRAAGAGDGPEIVRAGAALEMLHTMALIQDDVMDSSAVRRSRASTASVFGALAAASAGGRSADPRRFGASAAILTGMLGFVLADRLFRLAREALGGRPAAAERYDGMRERAIAGQYLDLLCAHRGTADEATVRRVGALKSGSYTVADPLAIGALLAGADQGTVAALDGYGGPLGEAFQIRDDILGVFGDPAITGKDSDGDIREGKQTLLLARALRLADAAQVGVLADIVGNRAAAGPDVDRVREIMIATGALQAAEDLVAELTSQAKDALAAAPLADEARSALAALADEATTRGS